MNRNPQHSRHFFDKNQSGVALVVGLVLLVVITLIAVSGLSNASLQTKLASVTSQQNMVFQAAESSVAMMFDQMNGTGGDLTPLNAVLSDPENKPKTTPNTTLSASKMVTAEVTISFMSKNDVSPGFSLNADENSTTISPYTFKVVGNASMASSGASATIEKGIVYE